MEKKIIEQYVLNNSYVELTSNCNLRCLHCYNESGGKSNYLSEAAFKNIINSLPDDQTASITLSGGEPLLHPQIFQFINLVRERNLARALIITNATLISEEIAEKLTAIRIGIQVSVNGSSSATHDLLCGNGNFDKTMKGIDYLLVTGNKNIRVRCMLSKFNKDDIVVMCKMLFEKGVRAIQIATLTILGRSKSNLESMYLTGDERTEIIKLLNNNEELCLLKDKGMDINIPEGVTIGCPYMDEYSEKISITPRIVADGNVYLCQMFTDELYSIGNVNENSIIDIVNGQQFEELVSFLRKGRKYMKDCSSCVWKTVCGRGCIALNCSNGSIQETDGECFGRKAYYFDQICNTK